MTKQIFLILTLLVTINRHIHAQFDKDTTFTIGNLPMREGTIQLFNAYLPKCYNPMPHVVIHSPDSTVTAVTTGVIQRITTIQGKYYVLIKKSDTTILYGELEKVFKAKNDTVQKGELLGIAKKTEQYELVFDMLVKERELNYDKHVYYLLNLNLTKLPKSFRQRKLRHLGYPSNPLQ